MRERETATLAPRLSIIVIVLLCAAAITWQARQLFQQMQLPTLSATPAAAAKAPLTLDHQALQRLFPDTGITVPASALQLVLQGSVVGNDPQQSHAIISTAGQGTRSVFAGEELLPGLTVTDVQRDHVLLSHNGSVERLDFPTASAVPAQDTPQP